METQQPDMQPTVGGMTQVPKNVFAVPDEELKDFYLKFAVFLNPQSSSVNRTESELLNILLKDLKKFMGALTRLNTHAWDEGVVEILTLCGTYSIQDNIAKKERMQMNAAAGQHLQFLTQMATDSHTLKRIYENYSFHYKNVEHMVGKCDRT